MKVFTAQNCLVPNPVCSSCTLSTNISCMWFRIIWQYTLPGIDSSVTPLQLSHSLSLPFFEMQKIEPFIQSSGTSQIPRLGFRVHAPTLQVSPPAFIISVLIPSMPGVLLFLRVLMIFLIFSSVNF